MDILAASLSARRAWIEITVTIPAPPPQEVALRKESVDRNLMQASSAPSFPWSLSARRAWIEITQAANGNACGGSLSARRAWIEIT